MENEEGNYFRELKNEVVDYAETRLELTKLVVYEKTAKVTAYVFAFLLVCFFLFCVIITSSLAAGFYFSSLVESYAIGFSIVAGINTLFLLLAIAFRKQLVEKPVINKVISVLCNEKSDEENS